MPESLLFDEEELVRRGEHELEHAQPYMKDPPGWFVRFFYGSSLTTHNMYNTARVTAEAVVRFEMRLLAWIDKRIDERIDAHCARMHHGFGEKDGGP